MTFLAPAILAATAAAALPVIIHLLNKTRVREVRWAAMRFLLAAVKKNERRLRIEDLLLLLLRMLLIGLLAFAFARPAFKGPPGAGSGGVAALMLVLDHSLSMGYNDGTGTRLEAAKSDAATVVDALAPGSSAGLVLASDRADTVIASPTDDLPLVRRRVELAGQSARSADLFPAIQAAVAGLQDAAQERREIHIFTDDQEAAWARADEIASLAAANPGMRFIHHSVGGRETANTSISAIAPGVAIPAPGESAPVLVTLRNSGEVEAQGVRVVITTGGERPENEAVIERLGAGESTAVPLNILFPEAGWITLTASMPPDRLPVDNTRALALRVPDSLAVLMVGSDRRSGTPFFLRNALQPVRADRARTHYMRIDDADTAMAGGKSLEEYSMIVLAGGGPLPEESRLALEEWVQAGGNLLVFPGDGGGVAAPGAVVPGHGSLQQNPGGGFRLKSSGFHHPVTSLWNDPASGGFTSVRFLKRVPLQPPGEAAGAVALLEFEDGAPALIEWQLGTGRVVAAAFALDAEWGNIQLSPSFVALIQRLGGHLIGEAGLAPIVAPGATFRIPVSKEFLGRDFSVRLPGSNERNRGGVVEETDGETVVVYRQTEIPGAYEIYVEGREQPLAAFAVQSPPDAGLLQYADPEKIGVSLSGAGAEVAGEDAAATAEPTVRAELWFAIMLLVAVLSVFELGLAHKFSVAK